MSEQPLDLRRFLHIVRRRFTVVGFLAALGLLAGAGYAVLNPPMYTSSALVALATSTRSVPTQVVVASSGPVLARALRSLDQAMSLQTLRSRVQVSAPISYILSINAQGATAAEAKATSNAVAVSYVAYANATSNPDEQVQAQVLAAATNATGTPPTVQLLIAAALGALAGTLIGVVCALAVGHTDRRLRRRDEIADAIGVPVLASVSTARPADAAGWARLLEDYQPSVADAWRLRNALNYLGLADPMSVGANVGGSSLTILSLSTDQRALALGPQLAVFAVSQGIPTALVIGPQQGASTAALRAACATTVSTNRSSRLRVAIASHGNHDWPDAVLTVAVAVMDGHTPQAAGTMRTNATVLGVSAGAATAEQLVVASGPPTVIWPESLLQIQTQTTRRPVASRRRHDEPRCHYA